MARRKYSPSQILEFLIVVGIILFSLYRIALAYDYVPYDYQPSVIFNKVYQQVKIWLVEVEAQDNFIGHSARAIVQQLTKIEVSIQEQDLKYKQMEETAKRCQENIIYRYFMFMGDLSNPNCSETNMQLKNAVGETNNTSNSNNQQQSTTARPAPAQSAPAQPVPAQPATIQTHN